MRKIDKIDGPEVEKKELIKLELFMDPDNLASSSTKNHNLETLYSPDKGSPKVVNGHEDNDITVQVHHQLKKFLEVYQSYTKE
jgi:hypothetical protein